MDIRVIFDKTAADSRFHTGWGVSFLVGGTVLFDTGENGQWLMDNLRLCRADIDAIEAAVISHDHWDHTGGLWELLRQRRGLRVYACGDFSGEFKEKAAAAGARLVESTGCLQVAAGIFVTGAVACLYKGAPMSEQAVAVRTHTGVSVITGCAHPGIMVMLETVSRQFPGESLDTVFGGFHLKDASPGELSVLVEAFRKMGIRRAGPTHCSGEQAEDLFRRRYGQAFLPVRVGDIIEV